MQFSPRQAWLATAGARPSITEVASGPAQCGKSDSGIAGWLSDLLTGHPPLPDMAPREGPLSVGVARSQAQLDAVVRPKTMMYLDRLGIPWDTERGAMQIPTWHGETATIRWVIAADGLETSAQRIQGFTLASAYLDELTRIRRDLVQMIETRTVTEPNPKIIGTCNPQGPTHWVLTDLIHPSRTGQRPDVCSTMFELADNPILTEEMIERERRRYSGAFLRRMVYGEWVAADGLIYPFVRVAEPPALRDSWIEVSVDMGAATTTVALLAVCTPERIWIADEWVWDVEEQGPLRVSEIAERMVQWAAPYGVVNRWVVPLDGHGLASDLHRLHPGQVVHAAQDVRLGIHETRDALERGACIISSRCPRLLREAGAYSWLGTAAEHGEDKPDQRSAWGAHCMDALRILILTQAMSETVSW